MPPRCDDMAARNNMARNGLTHCRIAKARYSMAQKRWCGGGHSTVRHGPFTTQHLADTVRHSFYPTQTDMAFEGVAWHGSSQLAADLGRGGSIQKKELSLLARGVEERMS